MPHFPKPFYRKSRKRWYVQINGKQHNLGPDKDQAFAQYHKLMNMPEQPIPVVSSGQLVIVLIDSFLDWCHKNRAAQTYEWYRSRLQEFVRTIPKDLTVENLRPFHVTNWIDSNPKWSNGTKHNGCKSVQRALRWACQQGYIQNSPIAYMEKPPMGRREVVVSDSEYGKILANIPDQNLRDLVEVTWHTGCRPQESLRVEARHVDLKGCRWVIPVSEAKTDTVRVVYLNQAALEITQRLMLKNSTGPLFRNSVGTPWTTDAVNCGLERVQVRMGKAIMKERNLSLTDEEIAEFVTTLNVDRTEQGVIRPKTPAELREEARDKLRKRLACTLAPRYCLYHLRHTWMNRLLTHGVDAMTVAILAGHSDPSMLAKTYQHLSQSPQYLLKQVRSLAG